LDRLHSPEIFNAEVVIREDATAGTRGDNYLKSAALPSLME